MSKKMIGKLMLGIWAILVLPIFSYQLANILPLTNFNLSDIGNEYGYRIEFIVWGIGVTIYFIMMVYLFLKHFKMKRGYYLALVFAGFGMSTAILIPYFPNDNSFLAGRHIDLAMFGLTCLLGMFFGFLMQLSLLKIKYMKWMQGIFCGILLLTFLIYSQYGMINSLLEIVFVSLFSIYLYSFYLLYIP